MMVKANSLVDVFKYINTHGNDTSVCWEWTGSTGGRDGRGYFSVSNKKLQAHRIVYTIFNGEIAAGMVIRHKCDNPICCNPEHLVIGTRSQNELDKYERDRAGFSHEMIAQIRRNAKLGLSYVKNAEIINKKFNTQITASGVGKIVRGERRAKG